MARRLRDDAPGRWHHLTNRGLAKRTMFEGERDFRMFLARIAKEVANPEDFLASSASYWARRKAKLADGTRPFRRISPARLVEEAVLLWIKQVGPLLGHFKCATGDAWTNLRREPPRHDRQ